MNMENKDLSVEYITSGIAARLCGVSKVTVIRWIEDGHLRAFKLPKGHYRIDRDGFYRFLAEHSSPAFKEISNKEPNNTESRK
ncbi:MAG: helix-turn-helix domain-containing protein [Dehalococcoidia bacterium]|nr:helix-turn-helix domain-containing protein [Dehalococcoidia bacterium]